ncbi:replication initiation protein A [Flavobacterium psychrophilum]|nr:replication initiation protein A [Flavobacterium psychrophilum]
MINALKKMLAGENSKKVTVKKPKKEVVNDAMDKILGLSKNKNI